MTSARSNPESYYNEVASYYDDDARDFMCHRG
jgi:hypothetical protein